MKCKITTVCTASDGSGKLAVLQKYGMQYCEKEWNWKGEIEIETFQQLVDLANEFGDDLIVGKDGSITVYDSYIE